MTTNMNLETEKNMYELISLNINSKKNGKTSFTKFSVDQWNKVEVKYESPHTLGVFNVMSELGNRQTI